MKRNPLLLALAFLAAVAAPAATLYVDAGSTNPIAPYTNWPTAAAVIQDAVDAAAAGDEVVVTNGVYGTGGSPADGSNRVAVTKALTLRSVNGPGVTHIVGYQVPGTINGAAAVRCVYLAGHAILTGFTLTNGATDNNYMRPIEVLTGGGVLCMWTDQSAVVSNCVLVGNSANYYGGGVRFGTLNNCVLMGNSAPFGGGSCDATLNHSTLTSNSAYNGGGAYYGTLNHCTLTDNSANEEGGGACCAILTNCTFTANSASRGGGAYEGLLYACVLNLNEAGENGGGAKDAKLYHCLLTGNSTQGNGGGAHESSLTNCTVCGNVAKDDGGGAHNSTLQSCIVYFNKADNHNNCSDCTLSYSCTTPLASGDGNVRSAPMFVDTNGWVNLRLQSNSPCINAGNGADVTSGTDLDGNPRIMGGTVDMGAYEFQAPGSILSYAWLQGFGLPTDGTADFTDTDRDGFTNYQEYRCGTDPTNPLSFLRLLAPAPAGTNLTLAWPSATGRSYVLECSTNLGAAPPFFPLATNLPGQPGTTRFTVTNAAAAPPRFFRVGVE